MVRDALFGGRGLPDFNPTRVMDCWPLPVTSDVRMRLSVEERREQLLSLGEELFSQRAFADISVDEIAEAANISKGLLYHYFPSKRELYLACVARASDALVRASEPSMALPPAERLAASLDAFIGHVEANLLAFGTLLQGGANGDADVDRILGGMRRAFIERTARDLGIVPSPPTRMCLLGYVGFASYTCMGWARNPQIGRDALKRMLAGAMLAAIASAAGLAEGEERAGLQRAHQALAPILDPNS